MIDGKARLVSDLLCDGLGACLGHCPEGAITIEEREAEPYNESKVMELMVKQGKNTVIAHLKHLKEHNEHHLMQQGVTYLINNKDKLQFSVHEVVNAINKQDDHQSETCHSGGCPGSRTVSFSEPEKTAISQSSALRQWPVQLHLVNPNASYFKNSDLLLAADCTAFAMGDFHSNWLKNKSLIIACPKLDSNLEVYVEKITALINDAKVNTITVLMMEVPCCGGLMQIVKTALAEANRKVPVRKVVVALQGEMISDEWI